MKRPIIIFDLETTGKDVTSARIVQFSAIKVNTDLSEKGQERNFLLNPTIPIPAEATAIHGITDEMVATKYTFEQHSTSLRSFFLSCDLAGFNVVGFDLPVLSEEFGRCGMVWPQPGTKVLDAMVIFKKMMPRTLAAAYSHYCGAIHEGAHNAIEDVKVTQMVMLSQMRQHPQVATVEEYAAASVDPRALDYAGKIIRDDAGEAIFNFGRWNGEPVRKHWDYAKWMLTDNFSANTKAVIQSLIDEIRDI